MKRPWQVWLVFAICVLGAAGAMAWLTREAVQADQQRRAAQAEAEIEQRVSLAVWRMDTELAPIIAAEVIRPASAFRPGAMAAEVPPFVLMQFQILPSGDWQSPQMPAPQPPWLARLQELSHSVSYQQLLPELPSTPLPSPADIARNFMTGNSNWNQSLETRALPQPPATNLANDSLPQQPVQQQEANPFQFIEGNRGADASNFRRFSPEPQTANLPQAPQQEQAAVPQQSSQSKENDFQQRSKRIQSAAQQNYLNSSQRDLQQEDLITNTAPTSEKGGGLIVPPTTVKGGKISVPQPAVVEQVGVSRPMWVGDRLLLVRRVASGVSTVVQGSWLDWPQIKARLLGEASDLLPKADLVPVNGDGADDPSRMLAGLPVRLVTNETIASVGVGPTLRWALWMGWGAVLVAVMAAAALLHGVMTLSERRAAFVSSVTHELRTPLTTFRMYAEMLARGMVPDPARRQEYFETLQKESERLTLLVENVLSYARLERGRKPQAHDRVTVVELLKRVSNRLQQRASQAGMECVVELNPKAASQEFTTDLAVVEQILFNLVDNAAKYARTASDRRIHVEANRNGQYVKLIVRDHGPGIGHEAAVRTQPFEKSAQESAESAPGVGLGLALCRRLARELGGRLDVAGAPGEGAEVTLLLPLT